MRHPPTIQSTDTDALPGLMVCCQGRCSIYVDLHIVRIYTSLMPYACAATMLMMITYRNLGLPVATLSRSLCRILIDRSCTHRTIYSLSIIALKYLVSG